MSKATNKRKRPLQESTYRSYSYDEEDYPTTRSGERKQPSRLNSQADEAEKADDYYANLREEYSSDRE